MIATASFLKKIAVIVERRQFANVEICMEIVAVFKIIQYVFKHELFFFIIVLTYITSSSLY